MLSWDIFHPASGSDVQSSAVQSLVLYSANYATSDISLLYVSWFLILSLLVTPSILRWHAISNTLSLCFCFSVSVHVCMLDNRNRVLNTSAPYMHIFCGLVQIL